MKNFKKLLSIILCAALLLSVASVSFSVSAFDFSDVDTDYKLSFTPQLLTKYEANALSTGHRFAWGVSNASPTLGVKPQNVVVAKNLATIITYQAPADGKLEMPYSWQEMYIQIENSQLSTRQLEFSIADDNGNILWPTDGKVLTIADLEKHTFTGINIPVTKGQNINFIFYSPDSAGGTISVYFAGHMYFTDSATSTKTEMVNAWAFWPKTVDQGADNYYFRYADNYKKVTDTGLDLGAVYQKKLSFTKQPLISNTEAAGGGYYTLTLDNMGWACGFGKNGGGASPTHSMIATFIMPKDGNFKLRNMTAKLDGTYSDDLVNFVITDKEGNILYPADKSLVTLGGEVQSQASISYNANLKAGDEINFVWFNANQNVGGISMNAEITVDGTTYASGLLWPNSRFSTIWPDEEALAKVNTNEDSYFKYYYSTDVVVQNLVKSAWDEFIQIGTNDASFTEAPNTIEAWVKVSEAVADDKKGIIVSNGGVCGYENDITVEMSYNGRPRIYNVTKDIDFTADYDLRTGEWVHLAFVNDTVQNKIFCYINGAYVGHENSSYANDLYGTQHNFVIGNNSYFDKESAFQGELRDVRFWSTARTNDQIYANQHSVITGTEDGLLGAWALNDYSTSVTYFPDKKSNNNGYLVSPYNKFVDTGAVEDYDYSIGVIGDTQYYVESDSNVELFYDMTEYMAALDKKPAYVMQVGDITSANSDEHYNMAVNAMDKLTAAGIPYSVALGNHDYPSAGKELRDSTYFNKYFTESDYNAVTGENIGTTVFYSEYYEVAADSTNVKYLVVADDTETVNAGEIKLSNITTRASEAQDIAVGDYVAVKTDNNYRTFKAGSTDYMILTLEFNPRTAVIDWANEVVAANPDYKVIVLTHGYTSNGEIISTTSYFPNDSEGQNVSTTLWNNFVSKHENIFMLFCGHSHAPDITSNVMIGENGNTVYQYMVAPTMGNGGDGVFLMMYFNEAEGKVDFRYYSPSKGKFYGEQNMFSVPLDNSAANTSLVEANKPNLVDNLSSFSSGRLNSAGYWLIDGESDKTLPTYKTRFYKDGVFTNETTSIVRQYVAQGNGTAKFLMFLDYVRINGGAPDSNKKANIDIEIYNKNGENITSLFTTGASAADAIAGKETQYVGYTDGTFNMISNGAMKGWIYAQIPNVEAGDSFYFVSRAHDMGNVDNAVTQKQVIYVGGNIIHPDSTTATLADIEGNWSNSTTDYPTSAMSTKQGYLGWYYKYVVNSNLENTTYNPTSVKVTTNIQGEGSITVSTSSASYNTATGNITLPHHNSLFASAVPATGYEVSAVYFNGIGLAFNATETGGVSFNVPCVENGGELIVNFRPVTVSVTIEGEKLYFDNNYKIKLKAKVIEGMAHTGWTVSDESLYDAATMTLTAAEGVTAIPVYETIIMADINGDEEVDILDFIRFEKYFADMTDEIVEYNSDLDDDGDIDLDDLIVLKKVILGVITF